MTERHGYPCALSAAHFDEGIRAAFEIKFGLPVFIVSDIDVSELKARDAGSERFRKSFFDRKAGCVVFLQFLAGTGSFYVAVF